jgi:hypothetical protein
VDRADFKRIAHEGDSTLRGADGAVSTSMRGKLLGVGP